MKFFNEFFNSVNSEKKLKCISDFIFYTFFLDKMSEEKVAKRSKKEGLRFHVIGFPHTELKPEYSWCAYTQKARCIIIMLESFGHKVFVYDGPKYSSCIQPSTLQSIPPTWNYNNEFWKQMAAKVLPVLMTNVLENDIILLATSSQYDIALSVLTSVKIIPIEFGIGYSGIIAPYRVFESIEWMHTVWGHMNGTESDGNTNCTVIQNSFDTTYLYRRLLVSSESSEQCIPYLFYIGRIIERKGIFRAVEIAKATKMRLIVAGKGDDEERMKQYCNNLHVDAVFVGLVSGEQKRVLFENAQATIVMTQYIGPFEGVHIESMLCGTPVLTTTWGVFCTTVQNGINGFKVLDAGEAIYAVDACGKMTEDHRRKIAENAYDKYSIFSRKQDPQTHEPECAALKYHVFFSRVFAHECYETEKKRRDNENKPEILHVRAPGTW